MDKELILSNLNLTGNSESWFDMWHTHADWYGEGNDNWIARKKYLGELIDFYNELKERLKKYPKPYQLWIWILESDSSQDAVFLHSPNPNEDNFPLKIETIKGLNPKDKKLFGFLNGLGLEIIMGSYKKKLYYYLFDKKAGEPLEKQ